MVADIVRCWPCACGRGPSLCAHAPGPAWISPSHSSARRSFARHGRRASSVFCPFSSRVELAPASAWTAPLGSGERRSLSPARIICKLAVELRFSNRRILPASCSTGLPSSSPSSAVLQVSPSPVARLLCSPTCVPLSGVARALDFPCRAARWLSDCSSSRRFSLPRSVFVCVARANFLGLALILIASSTPPFQ
jgi:hypothetical protein